MTKCRRCGFQIFLDIMGWYSTTFVPAQDDWPAEEIQFRTCINREKHEPDR